MSRVAIIALSSLLLVGLVGAVTFGFVTNWGKPENNNKIVSSTKAVQAICNPVDYKDACFKSMAYVKSDDPKEFVKAAFASAKAELIRVANNSTTLKELGKDPKTAQAVRDCKELMQDAIDDFQRSFDEFGKFGFNQVSNMLSDIKTWISATRTYQETCLDGFENTTGDASEKMRKVLQTAIQMSSNGLAIVQDLSTLLTNLDMSLFNGRRLLSSAPILGHTTHGDLFLPEWVDGFRRKLLEATTNLGDDELKTKANVVVAQDGSGKYKTIEEALKDIPKNGKEGFIIYIKEGVYNEYLVLQKWMTNVVMVGDGPTKTRITNNKNFVDGTKTFKTATLSVLGDYFMAKDIGVENTAGAIKHQAVAFRAQSDKSIFFNCHFDGYQDTLYAHTYRQFYRDCRITGTIDFIFGDASAFFQNCTFVVRKPLENQNCIVTAQGRMERHQPTGIFIHKSKIEADPDYYPVRNKNKAYLGRPWKEYSKTVIMESHIDDLIQPEGWLPWEGNFGLDTSYYGEYNNVGPGSNLDKRVKWRGIKAIVYNRAEKFMPPILFDKDDWIRNSGVPYDPKLSSAAGPSSISGTDEDPNAPVEAPSSLDDPSFSEVDPSTSTSHGSSPSSTSSSTSKSSSSLSSSSSSSKEQASHGRSSGSSSAEDTSSTTKAYPTTTQQGKSKGALTTLQAPSIAPTLSSSSETELETPSPTPSLTTSPTDLPPSTTQQISPKTSTSSNPTTLGSTITISTPILGAKASLHATPVTMRELERILMENEEMEGEDEAGNDDMSGNVPDGDEPSPARASPTPAPSTSTTIVISPSVSPSSTYTEYGPSPSPDEEVYDWIPPSTTPAPAPAPSVGDEADKASPPPKANSGWRSSKYELHVILSGMVMWVSLFM